MLYMFNDRMNQLYFIKGGIHKSVLEAVAMKSFAFGLFLKSQRQWACKPLEDEAAEKFRKTCQVRFSN